jgi:methyltransferase (TIGR00027 family)
MRERRPSQTASLVALSRALANEGFTSVPGFSDPFARELLSPGWARAFGRVRRRIGRMPRERLESALRQLDVIPLRVASIDAELDAAIDSGCRQLVLLGAGLDTRAYRMSTLAELPVFEIDHPATQAYKRRRAASFRPLAASVTYVDVNFERESFGERLVTAGFRRDVPTAWVWEGVVMYLTDDAVRRTLQGMAATSAPGSSLIANYHEREVPRRDRYSLFRRWLLWWWNEPQIGQRSPAAMHALVEQAGFAVARDTRPDEWARRLGARPPQGHTADVSHLLVALYRGKA